MQKQRPDNKSTGDMRQKNDDPLCLSQTAVSRLTKRNSEHTKEALKKSPPYDCYVQLFHNTVEIYLSCYLWNKMTIVLELDIQILFSEVLVIS